MCLNQPATVAVDGPTQGPYAIQSVTYEFLYDNQQLSRENQGSCRNSENESTSECNSRFQVGNSTSVVAAEIPCCDEAYYLPIEYQWRPLGTADVSDNYRIENINFANRISSIWSEITASGKSVKFRSKLRLNNGQETDWKESIIYYLYPGIPDFKPVPVNIIPACFDEKNGQITLETTQNVDLTALETRSNLAISLINTDLNRDVSIARSSVTFAGRQVTVSQIAAGNYELVMRYAGSDDLCTTRVPFTMTELDELELAQATEVVHPVCFNGTGSAVVRLYDAAGWQQIDFTLDGVDATATALPNETLSGRTVRVYRVDNLLPKPGGQLLQVTVHQQASDQNCVLALPSERIALEAPDPVTANAPNILPATCNIGFAAELQIEQMQGGSGEYLIRVLSEVGQEIQWTESSTDVATITVNQPGAFTVEVVDRNAPNCERVRFPVQLDAPEAMTLTNVASAGNACTGVAEGYIRGQVSGTDQGVVTLYRNGEKIAEQTTDYWNFENLGAGTYQVQLKRSPTCNDTVQEEIEIKEPAPFVISFTEVPISCQDADDAQLTATINGPNMEYDHRWFYNEQPFAADSLTLSALAPGSYRLEVIPRTATGRACAPYQKTYQIGEPTTVSARFSYDSLLCLNPATNALRLETLSGGSGRYDITVWRNGEVYDSLLNYRSASYVLDQIQAGQYQVAVRDAQRPQCVGYDTAFAIAPVEPLALVAEVQRHNECYGGRQGKIHFAWQGNRAFLSLADESGMVWIDQLLRDNQPLTIDTLPAGTYTAELFRRPGCDERETTTLTITEPTELQFNYTKVDIACFGLPTGQINGTLSGATPPYRWQWQHDGFLAIASGNGPDIQLDSLNAGRYILEVTDANDCPVFFTVDIVPLTQPLEITLVGQDISCYEAGDGLITAQVVGGETPYRYQWLDENREALTTTASLFDIAQPGYYYLLVTDNKGCQQLDSAYVYEPPGLDFPDHIQICKDQSFRAVLEYPETDVTYRWQADNGFAATEAEVLLTQAGNYSVSLTRPNGCRYEHPFQVSVLDVEFMASFTGASWAEVGDTVHLKEISRPRPDSVIWIFDEALTVTYDSLGDPMVIASTADEYTIGMYGYKDSCLAYVAQRFIFYPEGEAPPLVGDEPFGPRGIEEFVAYPNPSDGPLNIKVKMYSEIKVALFLYDLHGEEQWRTHGEAALEHQFAVEADLKDGTYVLLLVSPGARQSQKIIVKQ